MSQYEDDKKSGRSPNLAQHSVHSQSRPLAESERGPTRTAPALASSMPSKMCSIPIRLSDSRQLPPPRISEFAWEALVRGRSRLRSEVVAMNDRRLAGEWFRGTPSTAEGLISRKRPKEQVLRVDHRRAALAGLVTRDENDPRILRIRFKPYTVQTSFVSTASGARALFFLYLFISV